MADPKEEIAAEIDQLAGFYHIDNSLFTNLLASPCLSSYVEIVLNEQNFEIVLGGAGHEADLLSLAALSGFPATVMHAFEACTKQFTDRMLYTKFCFGSHHDPGSMYVLVLEPWDEIFSFLRSLTFSEAAVAGLGDQVQGTDLCFILGFTIDASGALLAKIYHLFDREGSTLSEKPFLASYRLSNEGLVTEEKDYTAKVNWEELGINERWQKINAFAGKIFGDRYAMLKGLSSKGKMKVYVFRYDRRDERDANRKYNYYILEGNKLMLLGNYPRAVHSYRNAVDYAPDDADAHNRLGFSLMMTGEYIDGIKHAIKAKEIDPSISNLAWYSEVPPNQDAEIQKASLEIEKSPTAEGYNARGALYFHSRRFNEAIADFNKSIALNPLLPDARNNLGGALIKTGDFAAAVKTCNIALSISRQTSVVNLQAARQAIALMETAKKNPSAKAFTELGVYYYQLDLFEQAKESFLKAEQLNEAGINAVTG